MNKKIYPYLASLLLLVTSSKAFSQQVIDTLELKIGSEANAFIKKVRLVGIKKQNTVLIRDGKYIIKNAAQKAEIVIAGKLINGTIAEQIGNHTKTDYVITNSMVTAFKTYTDGILTTDAYKDINGANFKEYYANGKIKAEGNMSLDKNKHYGRGITKNYHENGALKRIANYITETYTDFYSNGKKKEVSAPNLQESYNEAGNLLNRQYRKNNIRYVDDYIDGKLSIRTYENNEKNEVTEYYKNGVLDKKEILKTVNGEKRLLTYDKGGKLISNEVYSAPAQAGS